MRALVAVLTILLLSACGFQLRGVHPLPFESLHVAIAENSELGTTLKRHIRAQGGTRLVDNPQEAQAIFSVAGEAREKDILSLSSAGRVREFELRYRFLFRVHDLKGREFIPQSEIVLTRAISFSDEQVLSKEQEEALLYRDMQNDLVQQIMRRLAAVRIDKSKSL